MAEESKVNNTMLLVIAIVLGALVVVIYNLNVYKIRQGNKVPMASVLQYERSIGAGEKLRKEDFSIVQVPESFLKKGDFVEAYEGRVPQDVLDSTLATLANPGFLTRWRDLGGKAGSTASSKIGAGMREVALQIDPKTTPPTMAMGDYVDIAGIVDLSGKLTPVRLIEGVQIKSDPRQRTVSIELPRDVSLQYAAIVEGYVVGDIWLELRNPVESRPGRIELAPILQKLPPRAPRRSGFSAPAAGTVSSDERPPL